MSHFLLKLVVYPLLLITTNAIYSNFSLSTLYQPILVAVSLGIINWLIDKALIHWGASWLSTLSDFVMTFIMLYLGSAIFIERMDHIAQLIIAALLISIYEYGAHIWLLRTTHHEHTRAIYR